MFRFASLLYLTTEIQFCARSDSGCQKDLNQVETTQRTAARMAGGLEGAEIAV